jgi:NAD-dependent deacetylase
MYQKIVILTGAGISAESGIATFRDAGGVWESINLEDVATPQAFERDPDYVNKFHNDFRAVLAEKHPNPAHKAVAELERHHPGEVLVVTQNVDDLHERAGSEKLIHMHGELYKVACRACNQVLHWTEDLLTASSCPNCQTRGRLRPHVTWFYEMPMRMGEIETALHACDLFISIGTSGVVYPAAGFVAEVKAMGKAHTVELNLEPSEGAAVFHETIHGPASEIVPAYLKGLLEHF